MSGSAQRHAVIAASLSAALAVVVLAYRRKRRPLLSASQIVEYHEQGFIVVPALAAPSVVGLMLQQSMKAWKTHKGEFDAAKSWLQNSLLPNIHHHCSSVRSWYFYGPLVGIARQLIGPNVKGVTSQLTFKLKGNTMPFGWHQDNGYGELSPYNAVSCLTALDDADATNGCLWVVPASHRRGQLSSITAAEKAAGISMPEPLVEPSTAVPVSMRAGDVLLMHCHTLHRSGGNSSEKDRRILFLRYADADAVEVYNGDQPRLGHVVSGKSKFAEVAAFEQAGFVAEAWQWLGL